MTQNRIINFNEVLIFYATIFCNKMYVEKVMLSEGYNQLTKGYQLDKKMFMIRLFDGVPTQIQF